MLYNVSVKAEDLRGIMEKTVALHISVLIASTMGSLHFAGT